MRDERHSFGILERALAAARADEADAVFVSTDQSITRFAGSGVNQNMSEISADLMLRVIVDGAAGVASTTSFDDAEIARTAELAREAARHSGRLQNFSGLYRGGEPQPDLPTFDERVAALAPAEKGRALKSMFDGGLEAGVRFAGSYATAATTVACANTHGVRRFAAMTSANATVIATRGEQTGFATAVARGHVDLAALGEEATLKATLANGRPAEVAPGAYDVILEPAATAEVLEWLDMIAFSGSSFDDGSSFFVGNLGKSLLGANVTIADDAVDPRFLPFPFDLEGMPKRRVALIERGVVRTPVVDKTYADRLGIAPTANAWSLGGGEHGIAYHLSFEGGDASHEELIASTKRGIWVTRFNYVNGLLEPKSALMTGTTRDGTFLIEDGEVVARLPNLRWTQSIVEAYSRIEGLTRERRRVGAWFNDFGGTIAPAMKIEAWNFGSAG
jgi:predicted Zn-dependent protease